MTNLQDIKIQDGDITAQLGLSRFNEKIENAQRWVENEFVKKMLPVMPRKTGNLIGVIQSENSVTAGDEEVIVSKIYGNALYEGLSKYGKPFNWTNPMTQPRWGHYVYDTYKQELMDGVRKILMEGEGNGGSKM